MRTWRVVVGLLGVAAATYGVVHLLDLGVDNLVATLVWVVGGVALHDGLLAPACIVLAAVLLRLTHRRPPAAVVVGAIVLGTVTLVAVPVLGRFGARADNATLLDRSYVAGWCAFAGVVLALVVVGIVLDRRSRRRGASGPRPRVTEP
jgi:hypothetical protein